MFALAGGASGVVLAAPMWAIGSGRFCLSVEGGDITIRCQNSGDTRKGNMFLEIRS